MFPLLSFAKVANGYVDTGARLFELDGKPAVIFKSWYAEDTLAPCDFVFAVSTTPKPASMADWQIYPIDRHTQMVSTCFEYNDIAAEVIDGHPAFAQHIWYGGWTEGTDHVRFGYAVDFLPTSERDWQVQTLQKTEWSDCDMAVIDGRPAVVFNVSNSTPNTKTLRRALRLMWAKSPAPQGIEEWNVFDLAPVGKTFGLAVVECEGKPTVFFLGGRDPKVVTWDMYVAQLDPTSSSWSVLRLPSRLRPSQEYWSVMTIRGYVFFAFSQEDRFVLAQAEESQVLDLAGWRASQIETGIDFCKPKITSLNGLPAIAYFGREGITLARAATLAPQDQNDWTITPLHLVSENFSLAEIAGKPAITYVDYSEFGGALRYAYALDQPQENVDSWQALTLFAGWERQPGSPECLPGAAPLTAAQFSAASITRTIPITSSLQDPPRFIKLLVLCLGVVFILVIVTVCITICRRRRRKSTI